MISSASSNFTISRLRNVLYLWQTEMRPIEPPLNCYIKKSQYYLFGGFLVLCSKLVVVQYFLFFLLTLSTTCYPWSTELINFGVMVSLQRMIQAFLQMLKYLFWLLFIVTYMTASGILHVSVWVLLQFFLLFFLRFCGAKDSPSISFCH